ncbi:hypothetical protein [Nocardia paucivorans]|uniref:hypothetical protein n=1 Tax=Nocardia paucivorans TaxID=114259 RepID=UPI0003099A86|nr:hypothetical protein [Nocardia paucivorans]
MTAISTEYEDLTVRQQIGPGTDAVQGWPLHFPDGSAPLSTDSTAVAADDWYGFRDPNQSIYVRWVAAVHETESKLAAAIALLGGDGALDVVEPDWLVEGIGRDLVILPFTDRALFRVLSRAQRLALSDTVTLPLVFEAADKLRHVEHVAALRAEVESAGAPDIFADVHQVWFTDARWQPLRSAVEALLATEDWVEAVVAANLIIDPLIGRYLREQYLVVAAEANRDAYTPVLVQAWRADTARSQTWTLSLVDHLLADPAHGAANAAVITEWAHRWETHALAAAEALAPLPANAPGRPIEAAAAWATVVSEYHAAVGGRWNSRLTVGGLR